MRELAAPFVDHFVMHRKEDAIPHALIGCKCRTFVLPYAEAELVRRKLLHDVADRSLRLSLSCRYEEEATWLLFRQLVEDALLLLDLAYSAADTQTVIDWQLVPWEHAR